MLTQAEEVELARRIERGDRAAGDRLVEHNVRLVVALANKHRWTGREFEDLVQDGMIGLIRATEKFDPDRGTRFGTYATWWVRNTMRGRPVEHVDEVNVLDDDESGLAGMVEDEHAVDPHQEVQRKQQRDALKEAVAGLPHLQRRAFVIRNGLDGFGPSPKPLSFVAIVLGISRERVFQLDMMTRRHLRTSAQHLR